MPAVVLCCLTHPERLRRTSLIVTYVSHGQRHPFQLQHAQATGAAVVPVAAAGHGGAAAAPPDSSALSSVVAAAYVRAKTGKATSLGRALVSADHSMI